MTLSNIHELDVLRWEEMTDTVRKFPLTGEHWFRKNLFTTKKQLRGTDIVRWDELTRTRRRAPYTVRGQPAQRMPLLTRGSRVASVADIFISKALDAAQIEYLRNYGQLDGGDGARQIINDELQDMNEILDNTVEHACMSVARGSLAVSQLTSTQAVKSRGAVFTLTFAVSTLTAAVTWATNTTLIYSTELSRVFDEFLKKSGVLPTRAIHNQTTMDRLLQNTEVKSFLGEDYKTQLLRDGYISKIRGVGFQPYDSGDDDSGSWAKYWNNDDVLFLPPDNKYFEMFEADALIPSPDMKGLVRTSPGKYAYAVVQPNPPGIELFIGLRFLPVNRYPERTLLLDTVP